MTAHPLHRHLVSFLWILLSGCGDNPVPEQTPSIGEDVPSAGFGGMFESARDAKLRQDARMAAEIGASIEQLRGVVSARVHLSLPSDSLLHKQQRQESGAAVVLVRDNSSSPTEADIRSLVAASAPKLDPETVKVFFTTQKPSVVETVFVGPIEVTAKTAPRARGVLVALLVLCLLASSGLIVAGMKLRSVRKSKG